jgi:transaldolase / glucose-6-phosphate isomerase
LAETLNEQTIALPETLAREVAKAHQAWRSADNTRRLWSKDAALWTGRDEGQWLGWLDIIEGEMRDSSQLQEFGGELRADGFTHVLLLGMGGSSLGPEVLAKTLPPAPNFPRLHVLDSTDPAQVRRFADRVNAAHTLFVVASKSGTTLEPNMLADYFFARASAALGGRAGRHFIAITDPGSKLQMMAEEKNFRRVFFGVPSIGGRYSVLSKFGLVPLATGGHDVRAFLETAAVMARACGADAAPADNPGVALGLTIGVLALCGRDKLTVSGSPSIAAFGSWAEQLIAESTGKAGKGIIPIIGEPLADPSSYRSDRVFVFLQDRSPPDAAQRGAIERLMEAGHPVVQIGIPSAAFLAQEFFRFEMAIAVAGAVLAINPFDQPDVEASKVMTREITTEFETTGSLPSAPPVFEHGGISLYADERNAQQLRRAGATSTLGSWLKAHFSRLADGDYFAILAYLDGEDTRLAPLQQLRLAVRDKKGVATCLQFGPRFLHSTGQAYKGGPNSGVFLQITASPDPDLAIPGRRVSFGVVEAAQAQGDFRVLGERSRRILSAHIRQDLDQGLARLAEAARWALQ